MRHLIWIAVLTGCMQSVPLAFAQSESGTKGGAYTTAPDGTAKGFTADQLRPSNCGTPDDPKPCAAAPRKALKHYPARTKTDG